MPPTLSRLACATLLLTLPAVVTAQSLGTFRWQLQPYCNVLTMTVVQQGGLYRLDGTDDQCGAGARAAVTGLAFLNADGSVSIGLSIVTAPGGVPVHVDVTLAIATLGGTWRDSTGAAGAFVFTPGAAVPGSPRPGSTVGDVTGVSAGAGLTGGGTAGDVSLAIAAGGVTSALLAANAVDTTKIAAGAVGAADINPAEVQRRVAGACTAGQLMTGVQQDGTVLCQSPPSGGGGDITAVFAGTGLTGGATTGDATLAVTFGGPGSQSLAARSDHTHAVGNNTAVGTSALSSSTPGQQNVAVGESALQANAADWNTAVGWSSLRANTTGQFNSALGALSLGASTTGGSNVAIGALSLDQNTSGDSNTAVGFGALGTNATGSANVGIGRDALLQFTSGNSNIALGNNSGNQLITGSSNIYIGHPGAAAESNRIRIGTNSAQTFISGIRGVTTGASDAIAVVVDSNGQLGTVSSSRRTKSDIEPLGAGIALQLQRLRPVQFHYTAPFAGGERPLQYGLIAEEVEGVLPELVAYNAKGEVETVKYHVLPTLLLAEVQRLERERTALARELAALQTTVDRERTTTARELAELRGLVDTLIRQHR